MKAADTLHAAGLHAAAGSDSVGYYGRPMLKPPVWTWEIPLYFFLGGLAGSSAAIALATLIFLDAPALARAAAWLAAGAAAISTGLLIRDLGRPHRFLNMLRVFKLRSPMSVGAWVLAIFGALSAAAAVSLQWPHWLAQIAIPAKSVHAVQVMIALPSALFGVVLATYTGVLIGATAVPAWHSHHRVLPVHFGIAGLGCAAASLELLGFPMTALHVIGLLTAGIETMLGVWFELNGHGAADRSVREGMSGWLLRLSGVAGLTAFVLRIAGMIEPAAVFFLVGALVSRFGWIEAGRASASDPRAALAACETAAQTR